MASKKHFDEVNPKVNFSKLEEEILKYWDKNNIFKKSLDKNKGKKNFVFYEGPPTANGKPGIHHIEARAFKDILPRYKTMKGFNVNRKAGWDCHGLPVEIAVEKKLGISGKPQIEEYGVEKFNKLCRESVFEYVEEWEKVTKRIGYWVDLENAYETMSNDFIETDWYILKTLWEKDLLYEDYKVVPYCPRCGTPLSSHELAQGYKENTEDPSVYVKFKVKGKSDTYFLAWTTTPWTLPGNVALAIDPNETYVEIKTDEGNLILAKKRVEVVGVEGESVKRYKGGELEGWEYEPLFDFVKYNKKAFFVIPADFVSMEDGTGIVHTAVMYGEDDFKLGNEHDLPKKHVVDEAGKFIPEVTKWAGKFVKKADPEIVSELESCKLLFKKETIKHTYPFCWRCGTPLLYYALTSWYLKTTNVKNDLIANNQSVNWIPSHIKEGRMGEWLENNRDWALSRSRYWGTPLPVWKCEKCSNTQVVGSVKELTELSGKDQSKLDLHRPYIDELSFKCSKGNCDGEMERVPFVLDCWFDSGAMPYGQQHYPFENEAEFENNFPADYISEAIDQTRGWFYTLQAVSTLLGNGTAYKNVICLGHVLDEEGNKMSKSKGNVVNSWDILDEVGADATRWYFYSVISPGPSFRFSANLVKEVIKRFMLVWWNTYNFFVTYANNQDWSPDKDRKSDLRPLDEWVLARLQQVVNEVTEKLDKHDLYNATHAIEDFVVKDFSQWYIRRSRKDTGESFFSTSWQVLVTISQLIAPFAPFVSDDMYRNLTKQESVHLSDWPESKEITKDQEDLLNQMQTIRNVSEEVHAIRKEKQIPVRQPLSKLVSIVTSDVPDNNLHLYLLAELNIKDWEVHSGETERNELDTSLTPELKAEAEARQIIRKIQNERKNLKTSLDEKVDVNLPSWPKAHEQEIKSRALINNLSKGEFKVAKISS